MRDDSHNSDDWGLMDGYEHEQTELDSVLDFVEWAGTSLTSLAFRAARFTLKPGSFREYAINKMIKEGTSNSDDELRLRDTPIASTLEAVRITKYAGLALFTAY